MIPKKDYIIPRARSFHMIPELWNGLSETSEAMEKFHGSRLHLIYFFFNQKQFSVIYLKKDWEIAGKKILNKFLHNKSYFNSVWKKQKSIGQTAEKLAERVIKNKSVLSEQKKLQLILEVKKSWLDFDKINLPPWYFGSEPLKKYLVKSLRDSYPNINHSEMEKLCSANAPSLTALEELDVYKAALAFKKTQKLISPSLSQKYGWIPFGYDGPNYWDEKYYTEKIIALSKKSVAQLQNKIKKIQNDFAEHRKLQKQLEKKYHLGPKILRLTSILRKLFILTDERKKNEFKLHYAYYLMAKSLSLSSGLSFLEIKHLEAEEILKMFKGKSFIKYKILAEKRLNSPFIVKVQNGRIKEIKTGKPALAQFQKFVYPIKNVNKFSGRVANKDGKTKIKGRVRVILSSNDIHNMKQGEILVTAMTTPDFVPAMRKAKAIITDEGGITSHAAIVSRELGVPCIIGAKIATQVLKDGDMVEVNTNKGFVSKV